MSFFDKLSNVRKPDVVMNSGPLPTHGPPSFPNAKINYNSDLLSGISPYEYGEPDHISSQTSYTNIAHRIQKIVPCIHFPNANSEGSFPLSHAVDTGDIAFVLRLDRRSNVMRGNASFERLQLSRAVDPLVNMQAVNYLLAGIQRYWNNLDMTNWQQLLVDLRFVDDVYSDRKAFNVSDAIRFITEVARPFGIPHTSEMQGGQHEGSSKAVTFPVNFVSAFLVDGRVDNLCNVFNNCNISNGDELILKLEKLPISTKDGNVKYHLNHWSKQLAVQQFKFEPGGVNTAWQIVPSVLSTYEPRQVSENYDYREHGYWHILRSQVMAKTESADDWRYEASNRGIYYDDRVVLRGALLEGTFTPTWVEHIKWKPQKGVKRAAPDATDPAPSLRRDETGWVWGARDGGAFLGSKAATLAPAATCGITLSAAAPTLVATAPASLDSAAAPADSAKAASTKKPRRTVGMAVSLTSESATPVVVESLGTGGV